MPATPTGLAASSLLCYTPVQAQQKLGSATSLPLWPWPLLAFLDCGGSVLRGRVMFHPAVDDKLSINGVVYSIAEHPAARGIPYGQEGRQAVVYQLVAGDERRALKVFKTS